MHRLTRTQPPLTRRRVDCVRCNYTLVIIHIYFQSLFRVTGNDRLGELQMKILKYSLLFILISIGHIYSQELLNQTEFQKRKDYINEHFDLHQNDNILFAAAILGDIDFFHTYFFTYGKKSYYLELKSGGYLQTPLMPAVMYGHEDLVRYLLDQGANINAKDLNGLTPLIWSVKTGNLSMMQLLVSRGSDISICNNGGENALHYACENNDFQMVSNLVSLHVPINIKNMAGYYAAQLSDKYKIRRLLKKSGAVKTLYYKFSWRYIHYRLFDSKDGLLTNLLYLDDFVISDSLQINSYSELWRFNNPFNVLVLLKYILFGILIALLFYGLFFYLLLRGTIELLKKRLFKPIQIMVVNIGIIFTTIILTTSLIEGTGIQFFLVNLLAIAFFVVPFLLIRLFHYLHSKIKDTKKQFIEDTKLLSIFQTNKIFKSRRDVFGGKFIFLSEKTVKSSISDIKSKAIHNLWYLRLIDYILINLILYTLILIYPFSILRDGSYTWYRELINWMFYPGFLIFTIIYWFIIKKNIKTKVKDSST